MSKSIWDVYEKQAKDKEKKIRQAQQKAQQKEASKQNWNNKVATAKKNASKKTETIQQTNKSSKRNARENGNRSRSNVKDSNHAYNKLNDATRKEFDKTQNTYTMPKVTHGIVRGVVNNSTAGNAYSLATGKKLMDYTDAEKKYGVDKSKAAKVGEGIGTMATYMTAYGGTSKLAEKAATRVMEKNIAKKAAQTLAKKTGTATADAVVKGLVKSGIQDATVGTVKDLALGRGEGLTGDELKKYMAVNAALNFGVGGAVEVLPAVKAAIKESKASTEVVQRVVNGKIKNVKVKREPLPSVGSPVKAASTQEVKAATKDTLPSAGQSREADEIIKNVEKNSTLTSKATKEGVKNTLPDARKAVERLTDTDKNIIDSLQKRSNVKIDFQDLPEGVSGTYKDGVITISNKSKDPVREVVKHELTHHIENSKNYKEFSDFIENYMRKSGYDVEGALKQITDDYALNGINLDTDGAKKEFIAKYSEELLFNNEKSIERLARENPSVFRQVYEFITDTIKKIGASEETKFLIDAQRKYEKALKNIGDTGNSEMAYLFAGVKSKTADKTALEDAKKLEELGKTPEEVWSETGWKHDELSNDWKYEIDDSTAKALLNRLERNGSGKLRDFIKHPALFESYPSAKNVKIVASHNGGKGNIAQYERLTNKIRINLDRIKDAEELKSTLLHEVQHKIQKVEHFEHGGNIDNVLTDMRKKFEQELKNKNDPLYVLYKKNHSKKELEAYVDEQIKKIYNVDDIRKIGMEKYRELPGEVEARLTQNRRNLNSEERKNNFPKQSKEVINNEYRVNETKTGMGDKVENLPASVTDMGNRRRGNRHSTTERHKRLDELDKAGNEPAFSLPEKLPSAKSTGSKLMDIDVKGKEVLPSIKKTSDALYMKKVPTAKKSVVPKSTENFITNETTKIKGERKAKAYQTKAEETFGKKISSIFNMDGKAFEKNISDVMEKAKNYQLSIKDREDLFESITGSRSGTKEQVESFNKAVDELQKEGSIVSKYIKENTRTKGGISLSEAKATVRDIKTAQRNADKIKKKVILSDKDQYAVKGLLEGKLTLNDISKNPNIENIRKVYEAEKPVFEKKKVLKDVGNYIRSQHEETAANLLSNSNSFKDKSNGIKYSIETAERNFIDVAGKKDGQKLVDEYITPVHTHEASATKMKNEIKREIESYKVSDKNKYNIEDISMYGTAPKDIYTTEGLDVNKNVSESALVQLYGEGYITKDQLKGIGADADKITKVADIMRRRYNELIEAANQELVKYGYEPIEYRKDYFPHFTDQKADGVLSKIANKMGFDIKKDELPTDIAGLTHTFKPGKTWFGNALSRTSNVTTFDALKGMDQYLEGISDIIFHTEDIQKLRKLEQEIRFKYSDKGIQEEIKSIRTDKNLSSAEKNKKIEDILSTGNTKLSEMVKWIREYTDGLAGKKSIGDREAEYKIGRTMYNATKAVENRVAANMVALNPASWLTNFIPLVQGSEVSTKNTIKGLAETVQAMFKNDNFADMSAFLTNRKGTDILSKGTIERITDILSSPMKLIDEFTSETLTRAMFNQCLDKGMTTKEAMKKADSFAAGVIADRSKGALPTLFNSKNPIIKTMTMFQVEVNNQWSHLLKDIPRTEENVAKVAYMFTKFALGAYIFNDVYESVVGRRPALDPISWVNDFSGDTTGKKIPNFADCILNDKEVNFNTEKSTASAAIINAEENIAQDIPFIGGLLGGGRVPISSAIPNLNTVGTNLVDLKTGDKNKDKAVSNINKELIKPLTYIVPPAGGGQIKKAYEYLQAYNEQGSYNLSADGEEQLKFAVNKDKGSLVKGLLFGPYSSSASTEYVNSNFKTLSAKQTTAYKTLVENGMKPTEAEKFIRSLPNESEKLRNALINSDLDKKEKDTIGKLLLSDKYSYSSQIEYETSKLSDSQQETMKTLKKSGYTAKESLKIINKQKGYSTNVQKAMSLSIYPDEVSRAIGISDKTISQAKLMTDAKLTPKDYDYVRGLSDTNESGRVSIDEAYAWLANSGYTKQQKFALTAALTGCKAQNNPFR